MTTSFDEPPHVISETNIFFKITDLTNKVAASSKRLTIMSYTRIISLLHLFETYEKAIKLSFGWFT